MRCATLFRQIASTSLQSLSAGLPQKVSSDRLLTQWRLRKNMDRRARRRFQCLRKKTTSTVHSMIFGPFESAVRLPLLRKDFIFDEYQLCEAANAGADAALLIVAALDDAPLSSLREIAEDRLGMDALVEVHDEVEMKRAAQCGAKLIGVNNRDLRTFDVSLDTSLNLARYAPANAILH
jgi:hypothetical protein